MINERGVMTYDCEGTSLSRPLECNDQEFLDQINIGLVCRHLTDQVIRRRQIVSRKL